MDFDLSEDQTSLRKSARDFAQREVAPQAAQRDREAAWPKDLVRRMGELGFLGVTIPTQFGGAGLDSTSYALAVQEISRACASTALIMSVNNSLFCEPILKWGTDHQKAHYLRPCASGEKLGAFALTEPMSGSDAQTMATHLEEQDGRLVLNGSKNFITNGPVADFVIVFASSGDDRGRLKSQALLIPTDLPGIGRSPPEEKLGIRAAQCCTLSFDNVEIEESHLLGPRHRGFKVATGALDSGRISVAAQAVGIARAALERAVAYSKERKTLGAPIANLQAIQLKLADMKVQLDVAELLMLRAAWLKDQGRRYTLEAAEAKLYASEAATRIAHSSLQIHGGYGCMAEYGIERLYRDARVTEVYEGTSEIQRLVIAANLLRDS